MHECTIDDRALMHLQIVIIDKLRRGERFEFSCDDECGPTALRISPDMPLEIRVQEPKDARINHEWVSALERTSRSVRGLHLVKEPERRGNAGATSGSPITEVDISGQQLQDALNARIIVEQARGILAQADHIDMAEALRRLKDRAQESRRELTAIARDVLDGFGDRSV